MEVKTNKEYQAMQKRSPPPREVRAHEDRMLEHMEEADTFAARTEGGRSALKTEQADVGARAESARRGGGALEQELATD